MADQIEESHTAAQTQRSFGSDHFRAAQDILSGVEDLTNQPLSVQLAVAQVHATLTLAAALSQGRIIW